MYNCDTFYYYCEWAFSFRIVTGFCNWEYGCDSSREGDLDDIFSQSFNRTLAYDTCPGLESNLKSIIKASDFMTFILDTIWIFNPAYALFFFLACTCFRDFVGKNSKKVRILLLVGNWFSFVLLCVSFIVFYYVGGFKDFAPVKDPGFIESD